MNITFTGFISLFKLKHKWGIIAIQQIHLLNFIRKVMWYILLYFKHTYTERGHVKSPRQMRNWTLLFFNLFTSKLEQLLRWRRLCMFWCFLLASIILVLSFQSLEGTFKCVFKAVAEYDAPVLRSRGREAAVMQWTSHFISYTRKLKSTFLNFPAPNCIFFLTWTKAWALWQSAMFKNTNVCEDKPIDEYIDFCSLKALAELRSETPVLFLGLTHSRVKWRKELPEIPKSPSILPNYSKPS